VIYVNEKEEDLRYCKGTKTNTMRNVPFEGARK